MEVLVVGAVVVGATAYVARTVAAPFRRSRRAGCGCGAACIQSRSTTMRGGGRPIALRRARA